MWQENYFFERLYLVPGLRQFAPFVTMPSAPTHPPLTIRLFLDLRAIFFPSCPQFLYHHHLPSKVPSPSRGENFLKILSHSNFGLEKALRPENLVTNPWEHENVLVLTKTKRVFIGSRAIPPLSRGVKLSPRTKQWCLCSDGVPRGKGLASRLGTVLRIWNRACSFPSCE